MSSPTCSSKKQALRYYRVLPLANMAKVTCAYRMPIQLRTSKREWDRSNPCYAEDHGFAIYFLNAQILQMLASSVNYAPARSGWLVAALAGLGATLETARATIGGLTAARRPILIAAMWSASPE